METIDLPRLLYVGDVPVESTLGGSTLLYRLLQKYPCTKIRIIEGNIAISQPEYRLNGVIYDVLNVGAKRLLHSRLTPVYNSYLLFTAQQKYSQLIKIANDFQPEAILTVAHGFSWLTSSKLAKHLAIPLHLIVHDDILSLKPVPTWYRLRFNQQLKTVYKQASSRLCVSPYMLEAYAQRYGETGNILYPSRSVDIPQFDLSSPHNTAPNELLKFAYAGSIHTPGQCNALISLASVLQKFQCKLIIYASLSSQDANQIGLNLPNIELRSLISSQTLINTLRKEVDVLFLPMDFDEQYKTHMQLCFPSKLADYTAIGLPILIWGAEFCSAVLWAQDNPGVAEIVKTKNLTDLELAIKKLVENSEYRYQLAQQALIKGHEYFGYNIAVNKFYQAIAKPEQRSAASTSQCSAKVD